MGALTPYHSHRAPLTLPRAAALIIALAAGALMGCGDDEAGGGPVGTVALYDLEADISQPGQFFNQPLPSDLRLSEDGTPNLSGFPNPSDNAVAAGFVAIAQQRRGWSTIASANFRFSAAITAPDVNEVVAPTAEAPYLLINVDDGGEYARTYPTVATTLEEDPYTPSHLLAVAARPGFVLQPNQKYAFVLTDSLKDAGGDAVVADSAYAKIRDGGSNLSPAEQALSSQLDSLWPALEQAGIARARTVSAAVFTTGDVVAELAELGDKVRAKHSVTIDNLAVDADDGASHARFCEVVGTVSFPQFQRGTPPFDTEGLFELGSDGVPIEQRQEVAPVVLTLPNGEMPAGGYPLVMYFHGSGGYSQQVVDRGRVTTPEGSPTKGEGPAHVLAAHGFATVGSAHPVNPERLPGAEDIEYLNINNLPAFRDTFRQGSIEQRLYLDALLQLSIDPTTVASCSGLSLPAGETAYRFSADPVMAMGQSMGGMYTNMIGATEARIKAVVPTGAGGLWSLFIIETSLVPGQALLANILEATKEPSYLHPALQLLELGWEPAEPLAYMPRLAYRPLPSHPVRPVYEPVGKDDSFFPVVLYDAIALAYGHQQAGDEVWPQMQQALSLAELDGLVSYPVTNNLTSDAGSPFTGVVVQYEGDGIYDPHAIYGQLDEVKHQYGCFFETFLNTGTASVVAPAALGSACQ